MSRAITLEVIVRLSRNPARVYHTIDRGSAPSVSVAATPFGRKTPFTVRSWSRNMTPAATNVTITARPSADLNRHHVFHALPIWFRAITSHRVDVDCRAPAYRL